MALSFNSTFMQIKIYTKNLELDARQKTMMEGKISNITHLAHRIQDESSVIQVDLAYEEVKAAEDAYVCALSLFIPHATLRAETRGESLENALDAAVEKLKPQIEKYKAKEHRMNERHSEI